MIFYYAKIDHAFFTKVGVGLISLLPLKQLISNHKRQPSNVQSSYISNSSLLQAIIYPVGVSKVWSLFTWINICIAVKLCCVITKIGTRICSYTPYKCTKFQLDQSKHLQVRANFVICVKIRGEKKWRKKLKLWSLVSQKRLARFTSILESSLLL